MIKGPDQAATVLAEALAAQSPEHPVLVMGDGTAALVPGAVHWQRRGEVGTSWPPAGPFSTIALRLPKGRDELAMALHAAAANLRPGGTLLLAGGNDEGIRSAAKALELLFTDIETISIKRHCRVLRAKREESLPGLRGTLTAWRQVISLLVNGVERPWMVYPGLFAGGVLDPGTALLLDTVSAPAAGAKILDYGCGSGLISATLQARQPGAYFDMLDIDSVALTAAAENVPGGRTLLGSSLAACQGTRYDLIISNPPFHTGVADDLGPLRRLISQAAQYLKPGGSLMMVVQRRIALQEPLQTAFKQIEILKEDKAYRVWRAA